MIKGYQVNKHTSPIKQNITIISNGLQNWVYNLHFAPSVHKERERESKTERARESEREFSYRSDSVVQSPPEDTGSCR